jgi:hypothetical protein
MGLERDWKGLDGIGKGLDGTGRGTGKAQDGKPGSGEGFGRPFSKPSAFGVKVSAARASKLSASEFSSGLQFKKKKKPKKNDD